MTIDIEALAREADSVFGREGVIESQWLAAYANAVLEAAAQKVEEVFYIFDDRRPSYEDCTKAIRALKVTP